MRQDLRYLPTGACSSSTGSRVPADSATSTLRPGSTGFDIWTSTRPSVHDAWSTPVNLGAPVNSQFNEFHPNLSFDGRTLLFISGMNRKPNLGGFDIWMATRTPLGDVDREADELE